MADPLNRSTDQLLSEKHAFIEKLQALVTQAEARGFVLEIRSEPRRGIPAMGRHIMVFDARPRLEVIRG